MKRVNRAVAEEAMAAVAVVVQVTKTENLLVVVTAEIAVAAAKAAVIKAIVIHLQVADTKAEAAAQVQVQVRNHRVAGVKAVRLRVDVHQAVLTEKNVLTPEKRRSGNQSFNLTVFKLYPD